MNCDDKIILAPMAGVTDYPFRKMVRLFGNHLLFTEMVPAEGLKYNKKIILQMKEIQQERNIAIQLLGHEINSMVFAAQLAEQAGAKRIDINMGCPVKKIIQSHNGCYLMRDINYAAQLAKSVVQAVKTPVTVKTRLGFDETHINVVELAKKLEEAGVSALTVHGRTQKQLYAGFVNIEWIQKVKESVSIPIIANGDIQDFDSAQRICQQTGADGIMIGRAALGRPWILSTIETGVKPSFVLKDLVLSHFDAILSYYGKHGIFVARKHLAWYAQGKANKSEFCTQMYREMDPKKVQKMINYFF